jgi:hypothetical protein
MAIIAATIVEAWAVSERGIRLGEGYHAAGKSWAVVVGIDDYQKAPRLSYAMADAHALADVLRRLNFEVKEIYNERATRAALYRELFDYLPTQVGEQDRVLIFFAGHGETKLLRNGKQIGYLLPADGDMDNLAESGLSMSAIRDLADTLAAKHVLFLVDACYGGVAGQRFRGIPTMTDSYLKEITRERGRQLITAGGVDQRALEGPEWGHSLFTYYLLQGLDEGLADLNEDGIIPTSELYQYLDQRVFAAAALKGYSQRPELWTMAAERGEFVFVPTAQRRPLPAPLPLAAESANMKMNTVSQLETSSALLQSSSLRDSVSKPGNALKNPESYFMPKPGLRRHYRGEISEGPEHKAVKKQYRNVSSVGAMEPVNGEWVKTTIETNPGNRGRTVTYLQEDNTGILVKGWNPAETIFGEVLPYYAIRFPVEIPSTFSQFDRRNVSSGKDFDGDGKPDNVDMTGEIRIAGKEAVRVPAGSYDAVRVDFRVSISTSSQPIHSSRSIISSGSRWYAEQIGLVKEMKRTAVTFPGRDSGMGEVHAIEELEFIENGP